MTLAMAYFCAIGVSSANAEPTREKMHGQLVKSQHVLSFWENRGEWIRAPRKENCRQVPWKQSCVTARASYRMHSRIVKAMQQRLWYTLPATNDWRTSVRLAQRIYPGTDDWLLFISDREGGWGPFVMNHQGSGAGGWLQFLSGTFYAYVDDARADVKRRGFVVPANVWTWTHPLGQALTGAYMRYTGRDGCHWCL